MKKKALLKDTLREIRKSLGRFVSIFMIVGIGVAFFAGVRASVPVMKGTADSYFDDYNLMDIKVMSTIGMTKEDAQALKELKGMEGVYASYSMDVIHMQNNSQKVFKLMSMPLSPSSKSKDYINQLWVKEGRLPQTETECVIEDDSIRAAHLKLGDTITFESGTDEDIKKSLKHTTFTIVGKVNSPYYLSYEKGSSTIGSGEIDNYALIPQSNFKSEYYTEIYLTVQDAKRLDSYADAYFDVIDPVKSRVTSLGEKRASERFEDIKKEALKKVEDGRQEYEKQKKKYDDEIKKAQAKLDAGHDELLISQATLNSEKSSSQRTIADKEAELKQSEQQLKTLEREYQKAVAYVDEEKQKLAEQTPALKQQIEETKGKLTELDNELREIEEKLADPNLSEAQRRALESQKSALSLAKEVAEPSLTMLQEQLDQLNRMADLAQSQLKAVQQQIDAANVQIEQGKQQLKDAKALAEAQMASAQQQIDNGHKEITNGTVELEKQKIDGAAKLQEAKEKLDKSEEEINAMKTPSWYILDRHSHYSYMDYGSAADRMGAIAKVFPLFFFLVAALVCLTTMTRMVDEQRQEIGTLKALGYTKLNIAMKYIIYAAVASVAGGIFGAIVGMIVFPTVIYNAWGIMYNMPSVQLQPQLPLALTAIVLASMITVVAAVAAVYKELMEVPSQLMRPKAPKNGKKILLERVQFLWKRFNFIHKVTARNIFRYKKRFFMTVIGISGCTALLVAGFGIQDSIGEIAEKQYQEIYAFDVSVNYESDSTPSQREDAMKALLKHDDVKEAEEVAIYHGLYADSGEDKGIDIYVPSDVENISDYISLRTRKGHDTIRLSEDGAVITEKIAKMKNLSVGDSFAVDNGDGVKKDIKISAITENYVGHAIYMTPTYYKTIYHRTAKNTTILAKLKQVSEEQEHVLGNELMKDDSISSVTFYSGIASSFEDTISSLMFVVVVLIICAGLLAFVVLYNLSNVNISERLREIATIKVLGFYDKEVSAYVYRENIVLTLIGAFAGIFVGIGLHALIMSLAELETVMFGRNIEMLSFLYSVAITMLFSIMVNLVMYKKLKKIPMVESLKSVE